jgi:hypothetical protein
MIQMVVTVAASGIMAHPFSAVVHVRGVGMPFSVVEVAVFLGRMWIACSCRTVLRNVLVAATDFGPLSAPTVMLIVLSEGRKRKRETDYE